MHPDRGADAILSIDDKAALNDVHNFAVVGDGYSLGCIQGAVNVFVIDNSAGDAHHATAVD